MSLSGEESTQPFSDPAEFQRRIDKTKAEAQETETPLRQVGPLDPTSTAVTRQQGDRQVSNLSHAFENASMESLPDARLVLASPRWQFQDSSHSPVVRLPPSTDGREMIGVVQRTHDVDFSIHVPIYDSASDEQSGRLIPFRLRCNIFYDPASDDCLLVNESLTDLFLAGLSPELNRTLLRCREGRVVSPGLWRISRNSDDKAQHQLVDILILRRKFFVNIDKAMPTGSTKRPISDAEDGATKRRRLGQGETDETEVLLSITPAPPRRGPLAIKGVGTASASASISTPIRKVARVDSTPLLDLSDGEIAVVRSTSDKARDGTSPPDQMATYELGRLKRIALNPSTSVFTCQHSLLPENVVAKVARYKAKSAESLVSCAATWQREKTYLESLRHYGKPNIISLKAFDGRLFAIYVELLPSSLCRDHQIDSPFGPVEGRAILRDISSALAYLAEKEIAHNDIKPANIAYSPQRGGVLLDFGVATSTKGSVRYAGTPWYVPPDIFIRETRGAPADVWALGVTMLYVLGKIQLPDKTAEHWIINDVKEGTGTARKRMGAWVDSVLVVREKLDRSDSVEALVSQMLDPRGRWRIAASQIVTALDSAGRALVGA